MDGHRVLVVEDNTDGRETMTVLLRLLGHEVEAAKDGEEGVEKALAWRPDRAVVDIGLPVLNGFEVARRVKSSLGGRIRLIALTGYGSPGDRQQAYAAGFDAFMTKPADLDELSRLLTAA
jgi:CheY-like chemotaxis protein